MQWYEVLLVMFVGSINHVTRDVAAPVNILYISNRSTNPDPNWKTWQSRMHCNSRPAELYAGFFLISTAI